MDTAFVQLAEERKAFTCMFETFETTVEIHNHAICGEIREFYKTLPEKLSLKRTQIKRIKRKTHT